MLTSLDGGSTDEDNEEKGLENGEHDVKLSVELDEERKECDRWLVENED